jgi:hypothetical protein
VTLTPGVKIRKILINYIVRFLLLIQVKDLKLLIKMNQVCLFYIHNLNLARDICVKIFSQIKENDYNLSLNSLNEIMVSFISLGDSQFIKTTIEYYKTKSVPEVYIDYLEAIVAFMNDSFNWIDSFHSLIKEFKQEGFEDLYETDKINSINNISSLTNILLHFDKVYKDYTLKTQQNSLQTIDIGIVSCDIEYFKIFGKLFVKDFFKYNDFELKIYLLFISENQVYQYQDLIDKLRQKYKKLDIFICVNAKYNISVSSALLRFEMSLDVMLSRRCRVVILDIDSRPKINLQRIFLDSSFDIALLTTKSGFPWERYAAGVILIRNNDLSLLFLSLFQTYINEVLGKKVTWTVDQTTLTIVFFYLDLRNESIKVKNIESEANRLMRSIGRSSSKSKIKVKGINLEI